MPGQLSSHLLTDIATFYETLQDFSRPIECHIWPQICWCLAHELSCSCCVYWDKEKYKETQQQEG
jgi:hypothetical protein